MKLALAIALAWCAVDVSSAYLVGHAVALIDAGLFQQILKGISQ